MKIIAYISWIILGLVQFAAMLSGLDDKLGKFWGTFIGFILGQIPIIGTILGIRGAIVNWDWAIWQAIMLFIGAPTIIIILYSLGNKNRV